MASAFRDLGEEKKKRAWAGRECEGKLITVFGLPWKTVGREHSGQRLRSTVGTQKLATPPTACNAEKLCALVITCWEVHPLGNLILMASNPRNVGSSLTRPARP